MKVFYDYIAIIVFFIVFKWQGIYAATAAAMGIAALQTIGHRLIFKRFDRTHLITFGSIMLLGGATLIFHNDLFIKWKPSIVYWVFTVVLLGSHYFGDKPIMQRLLGEKIHLPKKIWRRFNSTWAYFFLILGFMNIYVVYHFSTSAWVNFKLFGTLGLTFLFAIVQGIYLQRHIIEMPTTEGSKTSPKDSNPPISRAK